MTCVLLYGHIEGNRKEKAERETIARAFIHVYTNLYIPRGSFFLSPSRPRTIDSRGGDGSLLLFFIYIYVPMCVRASVSDRGSKRTCIRIYYTYAYTHTIVPLLDLLWTVRRKRERKIK